MTPPRVSIVINTYNRAAHLRNALHGLRGLRTPPFEVVVVNGPSTDDTEAVLEEWGTAIKRLDCPVLNLAVSRNIGIAAAAGDIVAFIDDDAVPHPDWLDRILVPYRDPWVGAVGGYTVDNTGRRYQTRKILCDRFGNAHHVSDFFDERPLNRPGSPIYPSLLGTNSSFRMAALQQVGGFDHAFAYLLDETDLCLRLVDAGWHVLFEPTALIFHQFAASHIRTPRRIARTLYPSAVSKAYFVLRHGAPGNLARAAAELDRYRAELLASNAWFDQHREISHQHRQSLDHDLAAGMREGEALARRRADRAQGDLGLAAEAPPFLPFPPAKGLRICLVSQGFPPRIDAGIARWTDMVARELVRRGHIVHVITGADDAASVRQQDGLWLHRIKPDPAGAEAIMLELDLPPGIAAWTRAVWQEVQALKNFGLDVLSFPIWDLEGLACIGDPDIGVVMSLHTSYATAKPHKPEWNARPLYEHYTVRRMIAAEARALAQVPLLLANSRAVVADFEAAYDLRLPPHRVVLAPHGTHDLLADAPLAAPAPAAGFRVLFVGRFEVRKGFDLAIATAMRLFDLLPEASFRFVGGMLDEDALDILAAHGVGDHGMAVRLAFDGVLDRPALEQAYRDCDVVLMPSRYESFGLVAIEGMAAGKPVVALAAGGLAEVITDGEDGLLVPPEPDPVPGLVAALEAIGQDPVLHARLAAGARRSFASKFTVSAMVDQLEPAYRRAAASRYLREDA